MFILGSHSHNREYGCALLVCEHAVSLLSYELLHGSKTRVFYAHSMRVPQTQDGVASKHSSSVSSAVYQLLRAFDEEMRKKGRLGIKIKHITVYYAPPLSFTATEEVSLRSKEHDVVNEQFLTTVMRDAEKSFLSRLGGPNSSPVAKTSRNTIIERHISRPSIDGYPIGEYLGRAFKEFAALISFSSISTVLSQKIADVCHSIFRDSEISHQSTVNSILSAVRRLKTEEDNFLLAAILPDISFLIYVSGSVPLTHLTFGGGEQRLEANMARSLSVTKQVARSYTKLHLDSKLHSQSEVNYLASLKEVFGLWADEAMKAYKNISEIYMLPKTIRVVTSGEIGEVMCRNHVFEYENQSYLFKAIVSGEIKTVERTGGFPVTVLDYLLVDEALNHGSPQI